MDELSQWLDNIPDFLFRTEQQELAKIIKEIRSQSDGMLSEAFNEIKRKIDEILDEIEKMLGRQGEDPLRRLTGEIDDFLSWKKTLNQETQRLLEDNPDLSRIYAEMDSDVRNLLTLCSSPCIPKKATPEEIRRIRNLLNRVPQNHPGLKKYLHDHRNDITTALDKLGVEDVINTRDLEARLVRTETPASLDQGLVYKASQLQNALENEVAREIVARGDRMIGLGDEAVRLVLETSEGKIADFLSVSPNGLFNITEIKQSTGAAGAEVGTAREQIQNTVNAVLKKVSNAQIGRLEIAVPKRVDGQPPILKDGYSTLEGRLVRVTDTGAEDIFINGHNIYIIEVDMQ